MLLKSVSGGKASLSSCLVFQVLHLTFLFISITFVFLALPPLIISVDTVDTALKMNPDEFKAKYGVPKPPPDSSELVFHCQVGRRGAAATKKAYDLGYVK